MAKKTPKTTLVLKPDVERAMKHYMADTDRSFRDQSAVINELIMEGLKSIEEKKAAKISSQNPLEALTA